MVSDSPLSYFIEVDETFGKMTLFLIYAGVYIEQKG
jgi:hypothetical protein